MKERLRDRLAHAWNAFRYPFNKDYRSYGDTSRPDRRRSTTSGAEKSIMSTVINRISIDVASINVRHVRLDENDRFIETIDSGLNNILSLEANIDQTARAFLQDAVMSLCDEGCIAIVPVDTTLDPTITGSYDILSARVGKIIEWFPQHVKVRLYNEQTGKNEDIVVPKNVTAIVENPLYSIMNEPNSTLQRLIRKLMLMDQIDERAGSNKLDMIIQLPYVIKTEGRRTQAEQRRTEIENQLAGSKYGVAYTDGTEKIVQLNRPVENTIAAQVDKLTIMFFNQLGLTESVFNGTADEKTMLNYYNRTIEPLISAIVDEMKRKFLTKTARTQRHSIMFFRDPFKLVPVDQLAEIVDKFTRNEVLSSNEVRSIIGYKPSDDERADKLINKNNLTDPQLGTGGSTPPDGQAQDKIMTDLLAGLENDIDSILGGPSNEPKE